MTTDVTVDGAPAAPQIPDAGTPPVTPPVTPPATPPADPQVGFDPPATPPATPPTDNAVVYEKTGDASLDVALRFVGNLGFGPDHPAMQAVMKGDFAAIESALKALGDKAKGYEDFVGLAKDATSRRQAAAKAKSEATSKVVYDSVGGKERWAAIQAWATEHADANEKAELNAAFKAGGLAATSAAQYLANLYQQHGKPAPKSALKPDAAAGGGNADSAPLSDKDYGREVVKLRGRLGRKMEDSAEYAQLKARRAAGNRG